MKQLSSISYTYFFILKLMVKIGCVKYVLFSFVLPKVDFHVFTNKMFYLSIGVFSVKAAWKATGLEYVIGRGSWEVCKI